MLQHSRQRTFRGVTPGGSRGAGEVASRRRSASVCVIGHLFLEPFVQSPSVHTVDSREESAGETESRIRTSHRHHRGITWGRFSDLYSRGSRMACAPNCKSCLRVRVPFARKELWAIFSPIVFKSRSPCALGASRGGAGAWAHRRGRRASWCGRSNFLSRFREFNLQLQTAEVSLSSARANPRSAGRVG